MHRYPRQFSFAPRAAHLCKILAAVATVTAMILCFSGCASPPGRTDGAEINADANQSRVCNPSENLLQDTAFTREGEFARAWRMAQHTGELSFSTEASQGVLEIRRIATQPWMLFRQTVSDPRLSGATVVYSAEIKGDLPVEPRLHGFDHVGGLYIKVGRGKARLAEHEPNHGQWDWQVLTYEEKIPVGETSLRAGFVHQSGGALWARNPSLVITGCAE